MHVEGAMIETSHQVAQHAFEAALVEVEYDLEHPHPPRRIAHAGVPRSRRHRARRN